MVLETVARDRARKAYENTNHDEELDAVLNRIKGLYQEKTKEQYSAQPALRRLPTAFARAKDLKFAREPRLVGSTARPSSKSLPAGL